MSTPSETRKPTASSAMPADAEVMIDAVDVNKYFKNNHVLKGIDLVVRKGEVVCIVGPSGSGKTTFLRCLCQLEEHFSGVISIAGEPIGHEVRNGQVYRQKEKDTARLRRRIGFVFQSFNLFPHMNAVANVAYGPTKVLGRKSEVAKKRARELLDQVGLSDKYDAHPHSLSGGQQQRVAIARSLAMDPDVILFDEPTSALDSESVNEVLGVMQNLAKLGMTMVVVTHELAFARAVADTLVMMEDGEVVEWGPCQEFMDSPRTERARRFLNHQREETVSEI